MKFSKKLKYSLLLICIAVLTLASTIVYADNTIQPRTTESEAEVAPISADVSTTNSVSSNNVTNDLYLHDSSVTIDYPVTGNVFILANDVNINNRIVGNVFVLAQNVNIQSKAYINSSLFVCAENVNIDGYVFDLYSAANKLTVSDNGRILRDITACGDTLDLAGAVSRNANLNFENISVTSSINGNLSYSAKSESVSPELVNGEISFKEMSSNSQYANTTMDYLTDLLKILIVSMIIILVIVLAIPKFAEKEQKILENKVAPSIGYGAIALIAIPIICFILFCTVLGIMPALSILFAYLFLILEMVSAIVAIPISKIFCTKINKNTKGMTILISILLVIVIWLLEQIPVVGNIISLLVAILGLGILSYSVFHSKIESKDKKVKKDK